MMRLYHIATNESGVHDEYIIVEELLNEIGG
jgi:hypothetical protein